MMDQLFHLGHNSRFGWHHVFPIGYVNGATGQFIDYLTQNANALAHFLYSYKVAIVTVSGASDHYIKIVLLVIEIWMFAPQIVLDAASTQVRTRQRVRDGSLVRDH